MPASRKKNTLVVKCKVLPHGEGIPLPSYSTDHAAGMDLAAAVTDNIVLAPGERVLVPTGIQIAVPEGFEAQIRPRSGLASESGIVLPNSPGTVDPDYRGEVKVILMNLGQSPFTIKRGMRIAQMVISPVVTGLLEIVDELPETGRGHGGFGHTGV